MRAHQKRRPAIATDAQTCRSVCWRGFGQDLRYTHLVALVAGLKRRGLEKGRFAQSADGRGFVQLGHAYRANTQSSFCVLRHAERYRGSGADQSE